MRAVGKCFAAGAAVMVLGASFGALADGPGGAASAPADEGRKLTWSWNLGVTSDYIFRGISQNTRKPAPQGGIDLTYGIFYAGVWGSDVNFGRNVDGTPVANAEVDYYVGIKPVVGPITFDIGYIHYSYLGGRDKGPLRQQVREQDYDEAKLGASATFIPKLTTGVTVFLSPNYTSGQGFVTTVEGSVAYEFPAVHKVVPTFSALIGSQFGDAGDIKNPYVFANGRDNYQYWNAGLTLGIDKLAIDLRYWDTNIPNSGTVAATNFCTQALFGCDARFVATAKVTF